MGSRLERFSTMSVLVVDDHEANVALLQALLEQEGMHRITTETDARRVTGLLAEVDPDLVLLDLHMPHVDGSVILEAIIDFAGGSYLPVLVLTADATTGARDRALAHGARDFLTKPFDAVEVALRIANLLETRQLYTELRRAAGVADRERQVGGAAGRSIEGSVRAVLNEGSITPVFQPVVELDTLTVVGHEALARFPKPHRRGPAGWFTDAFEVGLGVDLEWLAVTRALPFLSGEPGGFLALNMSPSTILAIDERHLCDSSLCPRIVIELTEHVPIEDYSALHRALRQLRDAGGRLAADDLGSGYAGFRHLVALQPDIIKLDISLVSGIHLSRSQRALASALAAFALDVGSTVIAEGIEDAAELAVLHELGVPWAQGYYLGRPQARPEPVTSGSSGSGGSGGSGRSGR